MKFSKLFGKFFIALVVPSLMISSCALLGLEEEEDETETASASGSIPELTGTWSTACVEAGGPYAKLEIVHSGATLDLKFKVYSDLICSTALWETSELSNSMTKGDTVTLFDGTSGFKVSGTLQSATYTPKSDAGVTMLNGLSECGITTWALNTPQSVAGTDCLSTNVGEATNASVSVSGSVLKVDAGDRVTLLTKQ